MKPIRNLVAWIVSILLSLMGIYSLVEGSKIYVQQLNHTFIVENACLNLFAIGAFTFMFVFIVWVHSSLEEIIVSRFKYMVLSIIGFATFSFANILRIFIEIYFLAKVEDPVKYLRQWEALETIVGLGLMFLTLIVLFLGWLLYQRIDLLKNIPKQIREELKN